MRLRARKLAIFHVIVALTSPVGARASTCSQAAQSAELQHGLPAGLLAAIGNVESGGWRWSVNGNDGAPGHKFASAEEALRYTDDLLSSGNRTIDVGCFQVDLRYHPEAFARWQDGFDGDQNASAAAGILAHLHEQTGDWSRAIALYHSADPQRGQSYLQSVIAAWDQHLTGSGQTDGDRPRSLALRSNFIAVAVWEPGAALGMVTLSSGRRARLPRVITP